MKMKSKITKNHVVYLAILASFFLVFCPEKSFGATATISTKPAVSPLEISGWIPYWRTATGTADAIAHINTFKEISPFGYTLKSDGTLFDAMKIESPEWQNLFKVAREKKVRIIPSITSGNGDLIDKIMRDPKLRKAHIVEIMAMINKYNFDGVDLDYEGKKAETKNYFSLFLKELYKAAGKKFVICTIEPRTPLTDRFDKIPKDIQFANDFVEINKYCDRVRIMAYDQGLVDLRLNETAGGLYNPVADVRWVEKVIKLAMKDISKKKIVIGIPTYGHEYKVTSLSEGFKYDFLWSFNPKYGLNLALQYKLTPTRNQAGELSIAYISTDTASTLEKESSTQTNNVPIATTSISTSATPNKYFGPSFNMMWWSDAKSIQDKVNLAKKLGVRGVAIFKIDGGEDPAMWNILK